jgi:hypothetical protein
MKHIDAFRDVALKKKRQVIFRRSQSSWLPRLICFPSGKVDGFLKSPSAALRFLSRHCGVLLCTPHSSTCLFRQAFARLASEAFYWAVQFSDFYERIKVKLPKKTNQRESRINQFPLLRKPPEKFPSTPGCLFFVTHLRQNAAQGEKCIRLFFL